MNGARNEKASRSVVDSARARYPHPDPLAGPTATSFDHPSPADEPGATEGMFHYLVPTVGVETVKLHLTCRSGPHARCRHDRLCRYVQAVTWSEHPHVMTEVDYAGESTVAHAGYVDFVIVGETDSGATRFAWFYRADDSSLRRWWRPQQAHRPWQDAGHFMRGDALLYGGGDAWMPISATDAAATAYPTQPGRSDMYRHATGCTECRCDVLSQRADWQRTHIGITRYWGRSATKVLR